jgi:hypothetical protein
MFVTVHFENLKTFTVFLIWKYEPYKTYHSWTLMLLKRVNCVKFITQTEFTCQQMLTGSKNGVTKNVGYWFHTHKGGVVFLI